jgi:acyl carrier protein
MERLTGWHLEQPMKTDRQDFTKNKHQYKIFTSTAQVQTERGLTMEELLKILSGMRPDVDFETQENLIDGMILDSLAIVSLITEINDVFEVTITAKDILPENFNSAKALYALIKRLEDEE